MDKRSKKIVQASIVGVVGNAILAIVKIIAGVISGSFAVVAHGIDSIADVATFILSWVTAKIINRPPDNSFPYGYRRAEAITTTILALQCTAIPIMWEGRHIIWSYRKTGQKLYMIS